MGVAQRYAVRRGPKRVVRILSSNAVIRVDQSHSTWNVVIADDQQFKRLFDIVEHTELDAWDNRQRYYEMERICPKCGKMNAIRVTHRPGYPEGYSGLWYCGCAHVLAKIDAVRGRVSVRKRNIGTIAVSIADALTTMEAIIKEDEQNEIEARFASVPYERYSFIPPVGESEPDTTFDDVPF